MGNMKMDVRVYPLDDQTSNTRAFASVALDDMVAIRGIRVVEGEKGLFVSMPQSYDKKADEYRDIATLLDSDIRKELNKAVKDEYKRVDALPPDQRGYDKPEPGNMSGLSIDEIKLDIKVYNLKDPQGGTKAFAVVNVDDLVEIRGIRVVEGEKGLFATMPQSYDKKTGEYHDIAFPTNGDLRREINRAVVEQYETGDRAKSRSLESGLKRGAERAAAHQSAPKREAAKSRAGAIE
jgi:stage V sporulation protein G